MTDAAARPADEPSDTPVAAASRVSPWIRILSAVGLVPTALLALLFTVMLLTALVRAPFDPDWALWQLRMKLMVDDPADTDDLRAVLAMWVQTLFWVGPLALASGCAARLFYGYLRGRLLTRRSARMIEGIGLGIVLAVPGYCLREIAGRFVATGELDAMALAELASDLAKSIPYLLLGLVFLCVGRVLGEAERIARENAEIV